MSAFELYPCQGFINAWPLTFPKKDYRIIIFGILRTDSLYCPLCALKNICQVYDFRDGEYFRLKILGIKRCLYILVG